MFSVVGGNHNNNNNNLPSSPPQLTASYISVVSQNLTQTSSSLQHPHHLHHPHPLTTTQNHQHSFHTPQYAAAATVPHQSHAHAHAYNNNAHSQQQQQSCANCGGSGHGYRHCPQPVTSFGVICFRAATRDCDEDENGDECHSGHSGDNANDDSVEYLLVQRKDSLCFVEFVRGKYSTTDHQYILHLLSHMTPEERKIVGNRDFDKMWNGFWQSDHNRTFAKEYDTSRSRYGALQIGYTIAPGESFNLAIALAKTESVQDEPEFGFPKGRRNISESDLSCACREFKEESGVPVQNIRVLTDVSPFTEIFTGCNGVDYRHVYYLAELVAITVPGNVNGMLGPGYNTTYHRNFRDHVNIMVAKRNTPVIVDDPVQRREVRTVGWFTAKEVIARLGPMNHERRHIFDEVHAHTLKVMSSRGRAPHTLLSKSMDKHIGKRTPNGQEPGQGEDPWN